MCFFEMLQRDKIRLSQISDKLTECPLGSGALAELIFFEIDRMLLAKKVKLFELTENSLDSKLDRDFVIEFLSALSILSIHFSRISEDLIIWSGSAYEFIRFPDPL